MPSGSSGWRSPKCARAREQSRSARRAHEREPNALLGEENRILMMLAIVASELGSNIIKYGVRGSLEMEPIENAEGSGVSVVARDFGPPFHDLAMALEDGCDDRGPKSRATTETPAPSAYSIGSISKLPRTPYLMIFEPSSEATMASSLHSGCVKPTWAASAFSARRAWKMSIHSRMSCLGIGPL